MPRGPFRFLHASDLHLEVPLAGFDEVPDHLRQLCIDASYAAAERVFDTALKEDVQFVLFAGDVVNLTTGGARAVSFLHEQFERLEERRIAVYWSGGEADSPEHWPNSLRWPANVKTFPAGRVQELLHEREGKPLANILGVSRYGALGFRARDFRSTYEEPVSIALAHGPVEAAQLADLNIDYWALGGEHNRTSLGEAPLVAHFPGSPQGRRPAETGAHGCLITHVEADGRLRTHSVAVDEVRYQTEPLELDNATSRVELEQLLRERTRKIAAENGGRVVLVSWTVTGGSALAVALRRGQLTEELLRSLRQEFGHGPSAVYALGLRYEAVDQLPLAWYEENTIAGDYLRTLRRYETGEAALDLPVYLGEHEQLDVLKEFQHLEEPVQRGRAFHEAALLGAQLLRADDDIPSLHAADA